VRAINRINFLGIDEAGTPKPNEMNNNDKIQTLLKNSNSGIKSGGSGLLSATKVLKKRLASLSFDS
jgi:hypothetical protein